MIEPTLELVLPVDDTVATTMPDAGMEVTACAVANESLVIASPEIIGYDDSLILNQQDVEMLGEKAEGVERADAIDGDFDCSYKLCATRHGCSGATNCDYSYGDYRR